MKGETKFYYVNKSEKEAVFNTIAEEKGMSPFAIEKDWWVSRILETIFQMEISRHLLFKGGTSLSKAWKLINRFSEDIDLAIDRDFFDGFKRNLSRTQINKLRKEAGVYTTKTFFEELKSQLTQKGFNSLDFKVVDSVESDQDPRLMEIHYSNVIPSNSAYMLPRIQLEVSCRSLREPFSFQQFGALVDEFYAGREFVEPLFSVPTVNPERTFLEKLFLLHEEFHRKQEKIRVDRLSRHLYDIYNLTKSGIAQIAFRDQNLYETIVAHRYKFSRVGDVDYNSLNPLTLNPIPISLVAEAWKADYTKMKEEMIYELQKPTYEDLINTLEELRTMLQSVKWKFSIRFPDP